MGGAIRTLRGHTDTLIPAPVCNACREAAAAEAAEAAEAAKAAEAAEAEAKAQAQAAAEADAQAEAQAQAQAQADAQAKAAAEAAAAEAKAQAEAQAEAQATAQADAEALAAARQVRHLVCCMCQSAVCKNTATCRAAVPVVVIVVVCQQLRRGYVSNAMPMLVHKNKRSGLQLKQLSSEESSERLSSSRQDNLVLCCVSCKRC